MNYHRIVRSCVALVIKSVFGSVTTCNDKPRALPLAIPLTERCSLAERQLELGPDEVKTLLAHEWIGEIGGSERVFEKIRHAVPHDRAVCLWNDDPTRSPGVEETWLARTPFRTRKAAAMPFMGSAWRHIDLAGVERVVAGSHAFSHHLATRAASMGIPAFAYVYSPARYVWVPEIDDRGNSIAGRIGRSYFRHWDRKHVSEDVQYSAISRFVAERIADTWGVEASIVYPPVDVKYFQKRAVPTTLGAEDAIVGSLPPEFILGASRLIPYKNLDAAISAGEIAGLPVVIAGSGTDEQRLRGLAQRAEVPVTFAGKVSNNLLAELYRRASLFVYMPIEDFGIMPVEAIASGTPSLVNDVGGARESVLATGGGVTAVWRNSRFEDKSVVNRALEIDMSHAASAATAFSTESFESNFVSWLADN